MPAAATGAAEQNQIVIVIVTDDADPEEQLLFAPPESFEALADHTVSREALRKELSAIPGSMEADFAAERGHR
jgi:hypothetical protein